MSHGVIVGLVDLVAPGNHTCPPVVLPLVSKQHDAGIALLVANDDDTNDNSIALVHRSYLVPVSTNIEIHLRQVFQLHNGTFCFFSVEFDRDRMDIDELKLCWRASPTRITTNAAAQNIVPDRENACSSMNVNVVV